MKMTYLQNVSEACRISDCSRQHFYDIKTAYESQGLEGLKEKGMLRMYGGPSWTILELRREVYDL